MKKKEPFIKRLFKGWGYFIVGFIMNTWFCTVMITQMPKILLLRLLVGAAALFIINGLYFNYAYNAAKLDRDLIRYHNMEKDRHMSLKLALLVPIYSYVCYIILFIAKLGLFSGTHFGEYAFNYYILTNIHTLPWVSAVTDGRTMESLSWGGMFGLLIIMLIQPVVIVLTYELTLRDIDLSHILMYGKKKNK